MLPQVNVDKSRDEKTLEKYKEKIARRWRKQWQWYLFEFCHIYIRLVGVRAQSLPLSGQRLCGIT